MKIKLAIVENEKEYSELLINSLQLSKELDDIALYHSAEEFMLAYDNQFPDVVLMDIGLPGINGIDCIRKLNPINSETQFIVFTIFENDTHIFNALCAGATGYILKSSTTAEILQAIKDVHNGASPMSSSISRMVINYFFNLNNKKLQLPISERETQVLELLSEGKRYKEISNILFISLDTVRTHIRNIYQKLEVNNKTEAINKYRN
jgi:DNA-binding NarL/FixJ family response regulator